MNYLTFKIVHLTGLAITFMGLAGVLALRTTGEGPHPARRLFRAAHGLGLLIVLVSGFLLAKELEVLHPLPVWLRAKMVIWLLAGASIALALRMSRFAGAVLAFFALLVFAAAWLAIHKPI